MFYSTQQKELSTNESSTGLSICLDQCCIIVDTQIVLFDFFIKALAFTNYTY